MIRHEENHDTVVNHHDSVVNHHNPVVNQPELYGATESELPEEGDGKQETEIRADPKRFYILIVFSLLGFLQCAVCNLYFHIMYLYLYSPT